MRGNRLKSVNPHPSQIQTRNKNSDSFFHPYVHRKWPKWKVIESATSTNVVIYKLLFICGLCFLFVLSKTSFIMKSAPISKSFTPNPINIPQITPPSFNQQIKLKTHINSSKHDPQIIEKPSMADILESSRAQNLEIQLQTAGPFFRITAKSLETKEVLGKAEGIIRVWWKKGKILHLDSIKLTRETLGMDRSIFGIGLFIGAVMIRHGYDCGCKTAELLAINDSDLYHAKLVKFYRRIGFEAVGEVTGSSMADLAHMLVWGGVGTRMDANVERLLLKWCTRFTVNKDSKS
ncbi:hypothetical protein SSX86_021035 [Deinandra increscens subsp. villosa]|uniref:Uncharacterized protein n=1 Tax=Deinandra increscens subsp. villosa TaxID=3103831 RepID=A0AAP0GSR4_9ASTR